MITNNFITLLLILTLTITALSLSGQNNALHFDGIDDHVILTHGINGDVDFTVEVWLVADQIVGDKGIISFNDNSADPTFLYLALVNGQLAYFGEPLTSPVSGWEFTGAFLDPGICYHVALVKKAHDLIIYLDGTPVTSRNNYFDPSVSFAFPDAYLGIINPSNLSGSWSGIMDEFRIWSEARSQVDIQQTKNTSLTGGEATLTTYFQFEEGSSLGNNTAITNLENNSLSGHILQNTLYNFSKTGGTSNWVASCATLEDACPIDCCNSNGRGFSNLPLGLLPTQVTTQNETWISASGNSGVVADGCLDPNSICIKTDPSQPVELSLYAQSGINGPELLFEEGKNYCFTICAKVTVGIGAIVAILDPNTTFTPVITIDAADGWTTITIPSVEAAISSSVLSFVAQSLDPEGQILIDNLCWEETSASTCNTYENLCQSFDAGYQIFRDGCSINLCLNELDTCQYALITIDGTPLPPITDINQCQYYDFDTSGNYDVSISYIDESDGMICFQKDTSFSVCVNCICDTLEQELVYTWDTTLGPRLHDRFYASTNDVASADLLYVGDRLFATGAINGTYGLSDIFVSELNPSNGAIISQKLYGGEASDHGAAIEFYDDSLIVAGGFRSSTLNVEMSSGNQTFDNSINPDHSDGTCPNGNTGHANAFLMKVDATSMEASWVVNLDNHWGTAINDMVIDPANGDIYVTGDVRTGASNDSNNAYVDFDPLGITPQNENVPNAGMFVAVYYKNGTLKWVKTLYDASVGLFSNGIALSSSGDIFITGTIKGEDAAMYTSNGTTITTCSTYPGDLANYAGFVMKFVNNGNSTWTDQIPYSCAIGIDVHTCDDNLYVGGSKKTSGGFIAQYDIVANPILLLRDSTDFRISDIQSSEECEIFLTGYGGVGDVNLDFKADDPQHLISHVGFSERKGVMAKYTADLDIIDGFNSGTHKDIRVALAVKDDASQVSFMGYAQSNDFYPNPDDLTDSYFDPSNNGSCSISNTGEPSYLYINSFKCKCPGDNTNCCADLDAFLVKNNDILDTCNYSLAIDNNAGFQIDQVKLNLITPFWQFNTSSANSSIGYQLCGTSNPATELCVALANGSTFPSGSLQDIVTFNLIATQASASLTQEVEIEYYESDINGNSSVACRDTIMLNCIAVPETCALLTNVQQMCDPSDDLTYIIQFDIQNISSFNAGFIQLNMNTGGFQFSQTQLPLNPTPLPINGSATIAVDIISTVPLATAQQVCFDYGLLSVMQDSSCIDTLQHCINLMPCCTPCDQIGYTLNPVNYHPQQDAECCYSLDIINGCSFDYFTKVEITLINPDAIFSDLHLGLPNTLEFCSPPGALSQSVCLVPSAGGGAIPSGILQDVLSFCIGSISELPQLSTGIEINYYSIDQMGQEFLACSDMETISCDIYDNDCVTIDSIVIECDPVQLGTYNLCFNLTNNAVPAMTADHAKVDILPISGTASTIAPNPIPIPFMAYGMTTTVCTNISFIPDYTGPAQIAIGIYDSQNNTCCTGTTSLTTPIDIPYCDICTCDGYTNPTLITSNNSYLLDCNFNSPITLLECPESDPILEYKGKVNCSAACMFMGTTFYWTLYKDGFPYKLSPGGNPILQNVATTTDALGNYTIDLSSVTFWMPGEYSISSTILCNPTTKCGCFAEWIVPEECCNCITDLDPQPVIIEDNINSSGSCTRTFHMENVGPCDEIEWRWIENFFNPNPVIKFTQGMSMVSFSGIDDKTFILIAVIKRTLPDGSMCVFKNTAVVIPINCGGSGSTSHQFYHDGLLHTVVGDLEVDVDELTDMITIHNADETGTQGIDIALGQTRGYGLLRKYSFEGSAAQDEKPVVTKLYGSIDNEENRLISTTTEDYISMDGFRYARWTTNFEGAESSRLVIADPTGKVSTDVIINNGDPLLFRSSDGSDLDMPSTNTEHNHSRSNDDEIFLIPPSSGTIEVEAGSTIAVLSLEPTDGVDYYSDVYIRWTSVGKDALYNMSIIMFDDLIQNHMIGGSLFDARHNDGQLGILYPSLNNYEGLELSWPFVKTLNSFGVYHVNEWSYTRSEDVRPSIHLSAKGTSGTDTDQILGKLSIEPYFDGDVISFDKRDLSGAAIKVQVFEDDVLVYETDMLSDPFMFEYSGNLPHKAGNRGNGITLPLDYNLYWVNPINFYLDDEWRTGDELRMSISTDKIIELSSFTIVPQDFEDFTILDERFCNSCSGYIQNCDGPIENEDCGYVVCEPCCPSEVMIDGLTITADTTIRASDSIILKNILIADGIQLKLISPDIICYPTITTSAMSKIEMISADGCIN